MLIKQKGHTTPKHAGPGSAFKCPNMSLTCNPNIFSQDGSLGLKTNQGNHRNFGTLWGFIPKSKESNEIFFMQDK